MSFRTFHFYKDGLEEESLRISIKGSKDFLMGETGCYIWNCSLLLAAWLLSYLPLIIADKNRADVINNQALQVLELGCGCGAIGVAIAKAFKQNELEIILSDGSQEALDNCWQNLQVNNVADIAYLKNVKWGDLEQIEELSPDLIIGADILYDMSQFSALLKTLNQLFFLSKKFGKTSLALFAFTERNQNTVQQFLNSAKIDGLVVCNIKYERERLQFQSFCNSNEIFRIFLVARSYEIIQQSDLFKNLNVEICR
eukprot:TRINITY_DN7795_c0_g1_i15.p2 TRINITY_DN7795_c0_g1~~TRINITY_DN7795_c0_g1_i15.p2  ORF type:complete len:255 (-),score=20.24 TRINITY_DN7795_c0_g1_i15:181-945(-)